MSDQEKKQYSSLGLAVRANDIEGAQAVLDILNERKTFVTTEEWTTLLFDTIKTTTPEMAAFLKENGADIEASVTIPMTREEGRSQVMSLGYMAIVSDNKPIVEWMIEKGWIDEKMVSPSGDTVLVQAVREHAFEVAQMFLDQGMSIDHQNMRGVTALHEAASHGDYRALEWLMDRKADPTLETMSDAIACELVPEESEEPGEAEQLFQAVDGYYGEFKRGKNLAQTPDFIIMKSAELKRQEEPAPQPAKKPAMRT